MQKVEKKFAVSFTFQFCYFRSCDSAFQI